MEPVNFNGFESVVPLDGSGTYRLDFIATTDQYDFEIVGFSDNAMSKPEIAYSIDNFSFNLFDIDSTELLWNIGFDSLPEDIYSYLVEDDDTLSMGIISYDTIGNRLRVGLVEDEAPEYVGILMKDVVLEADRYYRFRPTLSVISTSNDLTGVMALTSGHTESNIRDMKIFDVNQASEMIFYSDSGGLQTLLLGVVGDSSTYYYVDSLSLELLDMSISELYSNDFSTSAAGWRSKFADSLELTAGRIDWQSEEETMRIWPWGNDQGVIGSVVREIDVVPGIYNVVMAKVTLPDHPNAKVSLGVYDELAANVNFSTLSVEPMAHAVAEDFEETTLYFTFRPNTDKMSLVMMYQSAEFGRVILDDVKVISIEPFERDTLLSMTFDDTSGVYDDWRSSIWPDSLISNDSILLSYISHDTLQGRMRLDMVEDVNNEEEGIIFGAATRKMTGLEVGRPYEISFEIQTDGTSQLKQANVGVFPNSMFSMGIVWDSQDSEELDSIEVMNADSITLRFTATESDMVISISANARRSAPYHYYIDNFQLKEGFVKTVNCDRSNLLLANQENRYRFGFNGQEQDNEVYGDGGSYTAEFWQYDPRLGRRWNVDPRPNVSISSYATFANNPIIFVDILGDSAWSITNKWDKNMISKFENEISNLASQYAKEGSSYTCEDFVLSTLIDFSAKNHLPVSINNETGSFSASSNNYSDVETFKNDVLKSTGARDLQRDDNTSEVSVIRNSGGMVFTRAHAGDIILFRDRSEFANHAQLITRVDSDGIGMSIAQGNSNWMLRIPGSSRLGGSNPQSPIYVGKKIELASWLNVADFYKNSTTGNQDSGFSINHNIQIRRFNFLNFNGK